MKIFRLVLPLLIVFSLLLSGCNSGVTHGYLVTTYRQYQNGYFCSYIIDSNNNLYAMSNANFGRISNENSEIPYKVMEHVIKVEGRWVLKEDGTFWRLDSNQLPVKYAENIASFEPWGELGISYLDNKNTLVTSMNNEKPRELLTDVKSYYSDFAIKNDDSLWLLNHNGGAPYKLFDGVKKYFSEYLYRSNRLFIIKKDDSLWELKDLLKGGTPVKLLDNVGSFIERNDSFFAVKLDHTLWTWGNNSTGQLGDGTKVNVKSPKEITGEVFSINATGETVFIIKNDNSVWTWGKTIQGDIGLNPYKLIDNVKEQYVMGHSSDILDDYVPTNIVFLKNDSTLWQINATTKGKGPAKILEKVKEVKYTFMTFNAITEDDNLWSWGGVYGYYDKNKENFLPKKYAENVSKIIETQSVTFFTKNDGSLWAEGHFLGKNGRMGKLDLTPWQVMPST